jgi:hypothetical protein
MSPERAAILASFRQAVEAGLSPQEVADCVFQAIRDERFWILTDSVWRDEIRRRVEDILQ